MRPNLALNRTSAGAAVHFERRDGDRYLERRAARTNLGDPPWRSLLPSSTCPVNTVSVARLLHETDAVAEVHNTLRKGVPVRLLSS